MSDPPLQFSPARLVLTGFMGSGKTTVGRLLAAKLGWDFADLDTVVEQLKGKTVPQIFAEDGEALFRAAETEALARLLTEVNLVIALGGGAPSTAALRDLLAGARDTVVVHLHAPFPVLYARCQAQALDPEATARPLLEPLTPAGERYARRLPIYTAIAHLSADVSTEAPETVALSILDALEKRFSSVRPSLV